MKRQDLIGRIDLGIFPPSPDIPPITATQWISSLDPGIVVGTCSKCCGPVFIPAAAGSLVPPIPTCQQCGAKKKSPYGPVVEME